MDINTDTPVVQAWVIWPVKIVSEMAYKVSSGTLSLYRLTLAQVSIIYKDDISHLSTALSLMWLVKRSTSELCFNSLTLNDNPVTG